MRHVLSRMALQLEGQTALLFRLARAWDRRADAKSLVVRLLYCGKLLVICKRGMPFVAEAMEVLAAFVIARSVTLVVYREMPVKYILVVSGNIICLDVLRVLNKQAGGNSDLLSEAFVEVKGQDRDLIARFVVYSSSCVSQLKNWGERLLISYSCWAAVRKCSEQRPLWCRRGVRRR
ncbi:hypothetical protein ACLBOM_32585 [Escherichia coli]